MQRPRLPYIPCVTIPTHAAQAATFRPRRWPRRILPALLAILLLLGAGYAGLLWWMSGQLRQAVENWAAQHRAQGWQVEYGPPESGGWPLAAALRLPGLRLGANGLEWRAEALRLSLQPWRPDLLRLEAEGAQQLSLGGPAMPLRGEALRAELRLNGTEPPLAGALSGVALRLESPSGPVSLEGLQGSFEAAGAGTTAFHLRLHGLTLPGSQPLGNRLEEATTQALLHGALGAIAPLSRQLATWRNAGGRLEVQGVTLRWGAMAASAAATLALDDALQPSGAGTLRLANPARVLEALTQAGIVPSRTAAMAGQILPMLTRLDSGSGVPVIELPVTLENRSLNAARIPLLRLNPVAWP
jgi:hypothetical protein